MKNLQRAYLKILLLSITLIITGFHISSAQTSNFRLKTADSLFDAKMYTQSYEHYEELLRQKQYTPAMFLKMAYIQEGLNNVGQAMYYLNLYFLVSNDKAVLEKMDELAQRFDLEGYENTDADQFLTYYHDHYNNISFALAAVGIFLISLTFHTRVKLKRRPVASTVILIIFLAGFFIHLNFGSRVKTGILSNSRTYIMDGPSPGAPLVDVAGGGHRVEVIGKKDIWLKIRWNGDVAYVRQNSLLPIEL